MGYSWTLSGYSNFMLFCMNDAELLGVFKMVFLGLHWRRIWQPQTLWVAFHEHLQHLAWAAAFYICSSNQEVVEGWIAGGEDYFWE